MSLPYWIIDVFSTTPYKGNPLAIVDNTTANLSSTQMKLMARQFNLSETTFFSKPTGCKATYRLRSFLPDGREVFGAGHNILGAWWFLASSGRLELTGPPRSASEDGTEEHVVFQELGAAVTPVTILKTGSGISVTLRQAPPKAHRSHPDPASLAASIGLSADEIGVAVNGARSQVQLQPQVMSTSTTHHLLVPVSSAAALNKVRVEKDRLLEQLALVDERAYGIFLFTPAGSTDGRPSYEARFFSPGMSGEDPATGSAAGPFLAYLWNSGALAMAGGSGEIEVHQGLRVGRHCVIRVRIETGRGELGVDVDIIGGGAEVADGSMRIPSQELEFQ
ncbi:phenazine biosynthesis protein [Metarhizium rileyi]|uniref:Phenazine biosynthesis protein n=1 Tax=Metarhizium rileyi (strain RCEF 4871) TaxID=1649241 RepID=A0A167BEA6_METRR|nr:phenazine biosynthesis protein [Metarhizium rileyi RCEF 4871]